MRLLTVLVAGLVMPSVRSEGWRIQAEIAGEVRPGSGLPEIPWRLSLESGVWGGGEGRAKLVATLPGGEVSLFAQRGEAAESYDWLWPEQRLAMTALKPALAQIVSELGEITWDGELAVSGEGTWREGAAHGVIRFSWKPVRLEWGAQNAVMHDVAITGSIDVVDSVLVGVDAQLRWAKAVVADWEFGAGRVELNRGGDETWQITQAETELWGGVVALAPFRYHANDTTVQLTLKVTELGAADIAKLMPRALAGATGAFSGEVAVAWSAKDGFRPGRGTLAMVNPQQSSVRIAPTPGLLSASVPRRIETLPAWLGPLARWASVENPAHADLIEIEMGRRPLGVERMEVSIYPDGRGGLRTVRADLVALPSDSPAVKRVSFGINVMGPWEDLILLSTSKGASISVKP